VRLVLALCLSAGMAGAMAPETSLRPTQPAASATVTERPTESAVRADQLGMQSAPSVRPVLRPVPRKTTSLTSANAPPGLQAETEAHVSAFAAALSLRPSLRPQNVEERAIALRRERQRGAICGNPDIQGDHVGRVSGRIAGCGIEEAVRVRSVAGVELTQRSVMDCGTATALNRWVAQTAKPALSGLNGGLARLKVAAHYSCRTRNRQAGARISEHGKGRAIDISGFHMRDGSLITVEQGWTARTTDRALRRMHRGACGTFGTVLGPEADRFHRDHFHFDTARYRSGSYCR
jgi:hypothetical protein